MADDVDRAQAAAPYLEERAREAAILAARERARAVRRRPPPGVPVAVDCADCGDPIPAARRAAAPGSGLCIDCATARERR